MTDAEARRFYIPHPSPCIQAGFVSTLLASTKQRQRKARRAVDPLLLHGQACLRAHLREAVWLELVRALRPNRLAALERHAAASARDVDHLPARADQVHLDS